MGKVKQINIKNRTYYFYNDQINLKDFDARLLNVDKKDYKEIDIYYIGYVIIKKIAKCNNINSVNPLYFGKVLKKKLKRLIVAKELNMEKIFKKLDLSLMMT